MRKLFRWEWPCCNRITPHRARRILTLPSLFLETYISGTDWHCAKTLGAHQRNRRGDLWRCQIGVQSIALWNTRPSRLFEDLNPTSGKGQESPSELGRWTLEIVWAWLRWGHESSMCSEKSGTCFTKGQWSKKVIPVVRLERQVSAFNFGNCNMRRRTIKAW